MKRFKGVMLATAVVATLSAQAQQEEQKPSEIEALKTRTEALEATIKKMGQLKVSGYVQAQWQWGQTQGMANAFGGGNFAEDSRNRFSIRRGRVKFAYSNKFGGAVIQLDATEKGVSFKDAYLQLSTPKIPQLSLTGGIFDRPFGYEISYSSSRRESPERSRLFQSLFPGERDMGAKITYQPTKTSPFAPLSINAGLFTGNGIAAENDSHKDFIGRIGWSKSVGTGFSYGAGVSLYAGKVKQPSEKLYKMSNGEFKVEQGRTKTYAKRNYYGADAQLTFDNPLGTTTLRGEYVMGQQPGTASSNTSPKAALTSDIYLRDFSGCNLYFVHDIHSTPLSMVVKYDFYDPNTDVKGSEIDPAKGFSAKGADVKYTTWGMGMIFRCNSNVRITAYYDHVINEKCVALTDFAKDIKDDLFTLRVQYKF